jgi:hypothetical protein
MKFRNYLVIALAFFASSFFLASCLNDDNKIPPNCFDGELNNGELFVDCGGPCEECDHCINGVWEPLLGETCVDCGGECGACPPCANCTQDGDEVGIDCGGSVCGPCADLCDDGLLNGTEVEIDCGGLYCEVCPTCTDGVMNGDEIGIDCGGLTSQCPPCATDGNCNNGITDGDEFWTDCGGTTCPDCDTLLTFKVNGVTHTVPTSNINFEFVGGQLTVTGISLLEGVISVIIDEPAGGWLDGTALVIDEADAPGSVISYVDPLGEGYATSFPVATSNVNIVRFRNAPLPGFARITFTGTLYTAPPNATSVSVTSGLLQVPLQ